MTNILAGGRMLWQMPRVSNRDCAYVAFPRLVSNDQKDAS
jgi:hypothetical protein